MKTSTDYFNLAIKNTFIKTSKITCLAPSSSFKALDVENKNNDEEMDHCYNEDCIYDDLNIGKRTVEPPTRSGHVETNREVSYSAKVLEEIENLRKMNINDTLNERVRQMTQFEKELRAQMTANVLLTREEMNIKDRLMWKMSESCINDNDLVASQKFSAILKRYSDQKWKEDSNLSSRKSEDLQNHDLDMRDVFRRSEIKKISVDFAILEEKMKKDVELCKNCSKLLISASSELKKVQEFTVGLKNILHKTEVNINDDDVETGRMVLNCLSVLAENIKKIIMIKNEGDGLHISLEAFSQFLRLLSEIEYGLHYVDSIFETELSDCQFDQINEEEDKANVKISSEKANSEICKPVNENGVVGENKDKSDVCDYVCKDCLEFYLKLEDNLAHISKEVEHCLKNTSSKEFIRNLKIAINTPINALSSLNAEHMQDKFLKISNLLRGRFSFTAPGFNNSTANSSFPFLIDFLSKKIINQGESLLIPSKPEDAFILASIINAIWIDFPGFGPVLLAHIMKRCPYTIPAFWPQYKGQSEKEFYISRGYNYKQDGTIEDQNSFLKRMTGIFMLYVAIMVSVPRKNKVHPYGLRYAWRWLAATINLDPRPDITAALLHVFLEMAGYKLSQYYRTQFWKIMQLINSEYMAKIEKVTCDDFRGPVSRLKEYISKVLYDGHFIEPKGILPIDYW